jgi:two-component system NtrC family sensor kinase
MNREPTPPAALSTPEDQNSRRALAAHPAPCAVDKAEPRACSGPATTALVQPTVNRRILIVDDNAAIHADFRKILCRGSNQQAALEQAEAALFGAPEGSRPLAMDFELESANQGQEALLKIQQGLAAGRPHAMAFVDVRMPPGWDGIETVSRIWQIYPDLQVVICTAYSDYSWESMAARLGYSNNLVILKKPFDNVEVLQLAHAFTRKWELNRQARLKLGELTQMVARRTEQLELANTNLKLEAEARLEMERQLRHAQKMEAVGQLAAGLAHDFNNILTIIHGHATMLGLQLGEAGSHAKSLEEIRGSTERAANLVRQLLTFSRKRAMHFRNVALDEVINSVSGMLRQLVGAQITVQTDCAPDLPPIHADRGMIEQILLNLALNARDAISKEGRVDIRAGAITLGDGDVEARPEARRGRFVCLTISDTGCGIGPQAMDHLFEPFFTTKEVGKGTGLGLATVYGIVKEHQGWIEVQSQVGAGATFQCYFPVSEQAGGQPPQTGPKPPSRSGTETILLAEDDSTLRQMMTENLTFLGYRVMASDSGSSALEVWRREQGRIDLLLTDLVMPGGMRGHELATELKRGNPKLKIIYTTGYSPGAAGGQTMLEEGVNFLPKPYPPDKLADIVRRCLDGHIAVTAAKAP